MYDVITIDAVSLDILNKLADLITIAPAKRAPIICPYSKSDVLNFAALSFEMLLNKICNALILVLYSIIEEKNNERHSQLMFFQCDQHKHFYSYTV